MTDETHLPHQDILSGQNIKPIPPPYRPDFYSYRRAVMGSSCAARRAGHTVAALEHAYSALPSSRRTAVGDTRYDQALLILLALYFKDQAA